LISNNRGGVFTKILILIVVLIAVMAGTMYYYQKYVAGKEDKNLADRTAESVHDAGVKAIDAATEAAKSAAEKSKEELEILKLKKDILSLEGKEKDLFRGLGGEVYELHKKNKNASPTINVYAREIEKIEKDKEAIERQIEELRGKKKKKEK
jgi:uncharacterized protein (UPF0333 family)